MNTEWRKEPQQRILKNRALRSMAEEDPSLFVISNKHIDIIYIFIDSKRGNEHKTERFSKFAGLKQALINSFSTAICAKGGNGSKLEMILEHLSGKRPEDEK